jgi:cytochrome c551/c552
VKLVAKLAPALVAVAVTALVLLVGMASALTMDEARRLFEQLGCTGCHNNVVAPDFEGTIAKLRSWAAKYASLDEAVASEAKTFKMFQQAKSWDELVKLMPGMTPELKEFFERVFEEARRQATATPTPTPTPAQTPTPVAPPIPTPTPTPTLQPVEVATPTPTVTVVTLPSVPVPNPASESAYLADVGLAAGIAFSLAGVAVLIAALLRKPKG